VAALLQKVANGPVATFTIGFGEARRDESEQARAVARHLGTVHTEIRAEAEAPLEAVERLPRIYDEPFADKSQLSAVLLATLTRRHVTSALSGNGGDELFGGHARYPVAARQWGRLARRSALSRKAARWAFQHLPLRAINALSGFGVKPGRLGDRLYSLLADAANDAPERVLERSYVRWRTVDAPTAPYRGGYFADAAAWPKLEDVEARLMYADCATFLPDNVLVKVDRAGMAVGLETRAPLLGRDVVEFAWSLPVSLRVANGESKRVLRRLAARYFPPALLERPRQPSEAPLADWLRGPLKDWADDLLQADALADDGLLRPEPILAAWREHRDGVRDRTADLWNILMYQAWRAEWH
jgi:asparagine synthase (glutamine-hydrolysing)